MGDHRKYRCRSCRRTRDEMGEMSWAGLCPECGAARFVVNLASLVAHEGEPFDYWRYRLAASVGAALPEGANSAD